MIRTRRLKLRSAIPTAQRHRVLATILLLFLLITTTGAYMGALEWDEGSFLLNAEYLQGTDVNFEESRPHTLSYLIAGIWSITGESTFAARLLIVLFGVAAVFLFYRITAREFANPVPLVAAFAFTPLLLYWSFHAYTDVPALFLVLLSYYLYREDRHLFAGVVMAVAVTVRYVFFPFAAGMAIGYLIERRNDLVPYSIGGVLGASPFFMYSYTLYGGLFSRIRMYVTRVSEWSGSAPFAATADSTVSAMVMLSTLLPAAATGWRNTSAVEKSMVLAYAAFFLFVSGNAFGRYWLAVVPFLLLMAYRGLRHRRNLFFLAVAVMVAVSGVGVGTTAMNLQLCADPYRDAVDYVADQEAAVVVSDQWAVTGYVFDGRVYSPFTDYETLRDEQNVTHVVTRNELPYPQESSFSNRCWTYYVYRLT